MMKRFALGLALACAVGCALAPVARAQDTVAEAMDALLTRIYDSHSLDELYELDYDDVHAMLTPREREVLATQHLTFTVDVPVVVSVLRDRDQAVVPYWLPEAGFQKTDMTATNMQNWVYEVWQKEFPAGRVELGINGFDYHRPHYLVSVGAQAPGQAVAISNVMPEGQRIVTTEPGAMTYRDWTELVLTEVPDPLVGQQLITSIRGRGREACVVGAFRKTPFPSSVHPDPVYLTWSEDPRTTQNVQWRTNTEVTAGKVRYRVAGSGNAFQEADATYSAMQDRMLANDRTCHWFTAKLSGLEPDTTYEYQAGSPAHDAWSETFTFTTAPDGEKPFRILHISDTQDDEGWRVAMEEMMQLDLGGAFVVNTGDLVGTGLEREDWDMYLKYGEPLFARLPMMPCIGNHDAQLGLGAGMYLHIFCLPENGAPDIEPRASYTLKYGNAELFVLDVMSDRPAQTGWLRDALAKSDATWKIAMFHFPLFLREGAYSSIEESWAKEFDAYGLDLVLTGHVHFYARSYPLKGGQIAEDGDGTVYVTSVTIPGRPLRNEKPERIASLVGGGKIVNTIDIDGGTLKWTALRTTGEVIDEFTLEK